MFVPESSGGLEQGLQSSVDTLAELAGGDPSASWVVMILGAADLVVAQLSAEAQQEIYVEGPDTHVCVVLTPHATAERVDGGWRLSGEWFPASGCLHAAWGMFGFPIAEGDVGVAAIPFGELRVKDTWHTVGMRGTGSNLVVGQDVFVPDHRVLRLADAITGSVLIPTVLTYMIGPYLGMASAALDHVVAHADKRPASFTTYQRQSDSRHSRSPSRRRPPRSTWPGCWSARALKRCPATPSTTRPVLGTSARRARGAAVW